MATRIEFHEKLCAILNPDSENPQSGPLKCYFQPPESVRLKYPCIVYDLDMIEGRYADDIRYVNKRRYSVTVIDPNPDSEIPDRITTLPYCRFSRHYTADNLHHYVFQIYD